MRRDVHVRFGGRAGETGRSKGRYRASARPYDYVRCYEGWLHLAIVMDLFSRKIVGWSMRDSLEAEIVSDAQAMAVPGASPRALRRRARQSGRRRRKFGLRLSLRLTVNVSVRLETTARVLRHRR